jgi:hypothetical protein
LPLVLFISFHTIREGFSRSNVPCGRQASQYLVCIAPIPKRHRRPRFKVLAIFIVRQEIETVVKIAIVTQGTQLL